MDDIIPLDMRVTVKDKIIRLTGGQFNDLTRQMPMRGSYLCTANFPAEDHSPGRIWVGCAEEAGDLLGVCIAISDNVVDGEPGK